MEEITVYVADDGARFDTKEECLEHEFKINLVKCKIKLWGVGQEGYVSLPLNDIGCQHAILCLIESDSDLEVANRLSAKYGYEMPTEKGRWYWSDIIDAWIEYNECMDMWKAFDFIKKEKEKG